MKFECKHINLILLKSFSACVCKISPCSVTHLADWCAAETSSDSAIMRMSQLAQGHQIAKPLTAACLSHCESTLCHCQEIGLINGCCDTGSYSSTCSAASVRVAGFLGSGFVLPEGGLVPALCNWGRCGACHVNKIRRARVEM